MVGVGSPIAENIGERESEESVLDLTSLQKRTGKLTLESGDFHVWTASLHTAEETLKSYRSLLSPEEISRASKYVFPCDQAHFVACRGILRELLGCYLAAPGQAIKILSSSGEKPSLGIGTGNLDIRFNLSHSNGFAVFAFSIGREIGIDTEFIKAEIAAEEIATRYFSAAEQQELAALAPQERAAGFFRCWTRKEAYVKARGQGLQIPLNSFSVTLSPGAPARLTSGDANRWSLHALDVQPGWASALVVEGNSARISVKKYSTTGQIVETPAGGQ